MKKGATILLLGAIVCAAGFFGLYYLCLGAHRELVRASKPELVWLKQEFKLTDSEFARITQLHEGYLPQCRERCRIIQQQNENLRRLLALSSSVTPEIERLLADRARTRAECEAAMLRHFLEVSKVMPPQQGQRYLEWVQRQTSLSGRGMESSHGMVGDPRM